LRSVVARAAIDALVVATVRDRDPQIANAPSELVVKQHLSPHRNGGHRENPWPLFQAVTQNLFVQGKKRRQRTRTPARLIVSFPSTGGVDVSLHTLGSAKIAEHRRRSPGYTVRLRRSETVKSL